MWDHWMSELEPTLSLPTQESALPDLRASTTTSRTQILAVADADRNRGARDRRRASHALTALLIALMRRPPHEMAELNLPPVHRKRSSGAGVARVHGAQVNISDEDGDTPLITDATSPIVRSLLDHGADPNAEDADGQTRSVGSAGWHSEWNPDVTPLLIRYRRRCQSRSALARKAGRSWMNAAGWGDGSGHWSLVARGGAHRMAQNNDGETALDLCHQQLSTRQRTPVACSTTPTPISSLVMAGTCAALANKSVGRQCPPPEILESLRAIFEGASHEASAGRAEGAGEYVRQK